MTRFQQRNRTVNFSLRQTKYCFLVTGCLQCIPDNFSSVAKLVLSIAKCLVQPFACCSAGCCCLVGGVSSVIAFSRCICYACVFYDACVVHQVAVCWTPSGRVRRPPRATRLRAVSQIVTRRRTAATSAVSCTTCSPTARP